MDRRLHERRKYRLFFFFLKINLKQELEKIRGCVLTLPDGLQAMLERPCEGIHTCSLVFPPTASFQGL